ncbi:transglycosylase domain-containing protein [Herbiconiux sp. KACC 21604]|uniref:transglycosylase domain-containing protein n=1 Tax=unclassified Herbiconiux TaxID=2618217 RepID=UPI001492AE91|nr:transglycosylase domain-containing protein [Herbiconiux sp. SALV-R1]QJU54537.1 PASTA domain-containing protein [Herbiconiux sp. SALV-R1]WPO85621.1 transglycosylase domain-containing protein [Herbiconiux sp. KACC 21604]
MSAIAGILVTAMVTPALAVTGIAANNSIGMFENLPSYIKPDALAEKTNIYATQSDGSPILLASVFEQNREEVGWDQINQFVKDAVIATEDPRFYSHGGVDIASTLRAAAGNALETSASGASTISMQYVRNIQVQKAEAIQDEAQRDAAYEEATKTSIDRKLKEIKLAIGLEKEYSKDDILLGYLNIAPFGGRVYGIQSAAQYYFGVNASDLTLAQAASLIATVNEPNGLRIDEPENIEANQARRDKDVLASMLKEHKVTQAQYDEAIATPVTPNIVEPSTGCQTANAIAAGFFCDYVTHIVKNDQAFGPDEDTRWNNFKTGGYQIYTSLDVDLQNAAMAAMNANVPKVADFDLGSSLVTVQPGTGRVLAMVQNKDFSDDPEVTATNLGASAINYSTDYLYGGSTGFQVGSTYKIFTLAEWLKTGHSLGDIVNGSPGTLNLAQFKDSCTGGNGGTYSVKNDGGANPGNVTVLNATANSVNLAYLRMAQKLDQCEIRKTAEAFGVHRADGNPLGENPADVLGTNEIAPLTMAAAFAAVANEGTYCSPIAIDKILDAEGNELPVPTSTCSQAVAPNVAATMVTALEAVINSGTATASNPRDGIPHFGKTGTTDSEKDTWFVGASTELATAVWVGNVVGTVSIRNTSIGDQSGGNVRHSIWKQFMTDADGKYGGTEFPTADSTLVNGVQVQIPNLAGMSIDAAKAALTAAGFDFDDGGVVDSTAKAGTVDSSSPSGTATKGSTVTVYTSNGELRTVPNLVGLSPDAAKSAIAAAGIDSSQVVFNGPSSGNAKVTGSSPSSGEPIRFGTDKLRITTKAG